MTITIRRLSALDSIAELTRLLNAANAHLYALGFNYTAVDKSEDVTRERIANGECYLAVDDARMVGTILFRRQPRGCAWYERPDVSAIHQFGVLPAAQRHGVGSQLIRLAQARAAEN